MAQINVMNLTYCYEGSFDNIFEDVSFSVDTNWKLGFIGRNGKGKTTFLNILLGKYEYRGAITASTVFDYFPYVITKEEYGMCAVEFIDRIKPGCEEWRVICELDKMKVSGEVLYRPFNTLSHGERTKVLLGVLFSGDNDFLLIDEPTNHLDYQSKEIVKSYLSDKKGFILVSHDRDILDECIDHVLVLNKKSIEVQSGNFSSWWENKKRRDSFEKTENEKHLKEIQALRKAADRCDRWGKKNESTKIGFDPVKEHDRSKGTRAYIGAKTKKMQARVKSCEKRIENEIQKKEGLLCDIENPVPLKLFPISYHKERLISIKEADIGYENEKGKKDVLKGFSFELKQGERVFIHGENGSGKSTLIKAILAKINGENSQSVVVSKGELQVGSGLKVSYINQDTSFLRGNISDFCKENRLEESLFLALLRQLDMERVQFNKRLCEFSEGQKKKVLIASSLMTPAHVYIWDEPLNYVDIFSRMQIEELILKYQPTMILVDHDTRFQEKIATRIAEL